ncbi:hypothetical protein [Paenibacillus hubeiensis]|uniref:hypothetical protein n=1 Tax=Paenibacillus hubeiensis TaxID=3077330 RepID=UPI0031B9F25D
MLKRIVGITIIILLLILVGFNVVSRFDGVVNKSEVVQSYDKDSKLYNATVTFDMINLKKITDLKIMVLYSDNTVEYHDVSSTNNSYTFQLTKDLADVSLKQSKYTNPEFLITWIVDGKKKVKYVYSGTQNTEISLNE